jgi:hypothetical protein
VIIALNGTNIVISVVQTRKIFCFTRRVTRQAKFREEVDANGYGQTLRRVRQRVLGQHSCRDELQMMQEHALLPHYEAQGELWANRGLDAPCFYAVTDQQTHKVPRQLAENVRKIAPGSLAQLSRVLARTSPAHR